MRAQPSAASPWPSKYHNPARALMGERADSRRTVREAPPPHGGDRDTQQSSIWLTLLSARLSNENEWLRSYHRPARRASRSAARLHNYRRHLRTEGLKLRGMESRG